ncbi:hypothetical protein JD974_04555 [Chromobacterium haemolyticum]|uniref:Four helix bundle protein n=1 Tax=Chromobacterium haemolyticum TaxID=394935 RepID=A0ABS3GIM1_9NEIS|nr:hypothetical protein [Chromobacterium haemolyticum]MBK0413672.1 hypothetical protein [Chromobacterium haemolyticum]MBO0414774.1 hypothetical protein [Chromobacterium haemolyticum]MBO0498035.1 hypothetical protein [Chromobacterium haemolyticum]
MSKKFSPIPVSLFDLADFPNPRRSRYRFPSSEAKDLRLPFVRRVPGRTYPHYWQPAEPQDYFEACAIGRQYAAHMAQLLKTNRQHAARGLLFRIASDMDFADKSYRIGLCKGFFNYLEMLLNLAVERVDLAQHVEAVQQLYLCLEQLAETQQQQRRKKRGRRRQR